MARRELVTRRELADWMTQQLKRRYLYPDAEVLKVEKLPAPDSDGCNWRIGASVANASVFDARQIRQEAKRRFNVKG